MRSFRKIQKPVSPRPRRSVAPKAQGDAREPSAYEVPNLGLHEVQKPEYEHVSGLHVVSTSLVVHDEPASDLAPEGAAGGERARERRVVKELLDASTVFAAETPPAAVPAGVGAAGAAGVAGAGAGGAGGTDATGVMGVPVVAGGVDAAATSSGTTSTRGTDAALSGAADTTPSAVSSAASAVVSLPAVASPVDAAVPLPASGATTSSAAHPQATADTPSAPTTPAEEADEQVSQAPKRVSKGVLRVLSCCFALVFAVLLATTAYSFVDTNTVSESENRTLTTQPALTLETWFSGDFMDRFESFLSDHLLFRSYLIQIAQWVDDIIGLKMDIQVETGAGLNENTTSSSTVSNEAPIEEASSQRYVVLDDRVVATYQHNQPTIDYFESAVEHLFAAVPDNVNKYLLVTPSRISFETADVKNQSDDPEQDIQEIYAAMPSTVTTVDVFAALGQHSDEATFFRTDHHWTMLGSYYGAQAFFDAAGVSYIPLEAYEQLEGPTFLGYLYANFPSSTLQQHPDDLTYYVHDGDIKDETVVLSGGTGKFSTVTGKVIDTSRAGYYSFVETSFSQAVIEGNPASDRTLMVVSDSYMQAIAPWLADNFSRVILIDPRYFDGGSSGMLDLINEYGVTDFLVLQSSMNLPYATFSTLLMRLGG